MFWSEGLPSVKVNDPTPSPSMMPWRAATPSSLLKEAPATRPPLSEASPVQRPWEIRSVPVLPRHLRKLRISGRPMSCSDPYNSPIEGMNPPVLSIPEATTGEPQSETIHRAQDIAVAGGLSTPEARLAASRDHAESSHTDGSFN